MSMSLRLRRKMASSMATVFRRKSSIPFYPDRHLICVLDGAVNKDRECGGGVYMMNRFFRTLDAKGFRYTAPESHDCNYQELYTFKMAVLMGLRRGFDEMTSFTDSWFIIDFLMRNEVEASRRYCNLLCEIRELIKSAPGIVRVPNYVGHDFVHPAHLMAQIGIRGRHGTRNPIDIGEGVQIVYDLMNDVNDRPFLGPGLASCVSFIKRRICSWNNPLSPFSWPRCIPRTSVRRI